MTIEAIQEAGKNNVEAEALPEDLEDPAVNDSDPEDTPEDPAPEDNPEPKDEPEELVISIGDEELKDDDEIDEKDPNWTTQLRKRDRESRRQIRELKEQLRIRETQQVDPEPQIKSTPKPTLESCDFDTEQYENDLEVWHENQRKIKEAESKAQEKTKVDQASWQERISTYQKAKTELKVRDFDDAEHTIKDVLSVTQQGILLQGADNAALLIYALGKNPKKAKELAALSDPVKFAFAIAKLETQLKVAPRKAPPPEKMLKNSGGGASSSAASDAHLATLEAEAEKTGNRSKIIEYKRNLKNQSK